MAHTADMPCLSLSLSRAVCEVRFSSRLVGEESGETRLGDLCHRQPGGAQSEVAKSDDHWIRLGSFTIFLGGEGGVGCNLGKIGRFGQESFRHFVFLSADQNLLINTLTI